MVVLRLRSLVPLVLQKRICYLVPHTLERAKYSSIKLLTGTCMRLNLSVKAKKHSTKGDTAIRRTFSLVALDYKDRIFKLVRIFCNLHGSVEKYINFSIGVTSQQLVAFKVVKSCVFRTHHSFSRFHTEYNFDQISRKCRSTFQRYKR